jgi:hypothetical protein
LLAAGARCKRESTKDMEEDERNVIKKLIDALFTKKTQEMAH